VTELTEALARMPDAGQARLDLSGLTFIDSTGLHAIVEFARSDCANGRLILEGPSPMLVRMFEITGLEKHPNLEIRAGDG
jgi:anti-anti-sigma factor